VSWDWWYWRMYAIMTRPVSIRDSWYVGNLDDIARSAQNAGGKRTPSPCRRRITHCCELCRPLLTRYLVVGPFFLQLCVLLSSPLLNPKDIDAKHDHHDKRDSSHDATCNCANIRAVRYGKAWIRYARVVSAAAAALGYKGADLAFAARRTRWRDTRGTFETSLEDCSECMLNT